MKDKTSRQKTASDTLNWNWIALKLASMCLYVGVSCKAPNNFICSFVSFALNGFPVLVYPAVLHLPLIDCFVQLFCQISSLHSNFSTASAQLVNFPYCEETITIVGTIRPKPRDHDTFFVLSSPDTQNAIHSNLYIFWFECQGY